MWVFFCVEFLYIQLAIGIRGYKRVSMLNTFDRNIQMPIEWCRLPHCQHQHLDEQNDSFCHHIRQSNVGNSHISKHFHQLAAINVQMFWKKIRTMKIKTFENSIREYSKRFYKMCHVNLRYRSGEIDTGQMWWSSDCIAKYRSISWYKVDYTSWYAGFSHYLKNNPIR